jgi:hypothetical protein
VSACRGNQGGRGEIGACPADVEVELTMVEGTTGLRRRRGNRLGTAVDNGGSSLECTQRGGVVEMRLYGCENEGGGE